MKYSNSTFFHSHHTVGAFCDLPQTFGLISSYPPHFPTKQFNIPYLSIQYGTFTQIPRIGDRFVSLVEASHLKYSSVDSVDIFSYSIDIIYVVGFQTLHSIPYLRWKLAFALFSLCLYYYLPLIVPHYYQPPHAQIVTQLFLNVKNKLYSLSLLKQLSNKHHQDLDDDILHRVGNLQIYDVPDPSCLLPSWNCCCQPMFRIRGCILV